MTTREEKQTIIVTFHRKDRRKDQSSDKVELTRKMVRAADRVLDVDLYDAPDPVAPDSHRSDDHCPARRRRYATVTSFAR